MRRMTLPVVIALVLGFALPFSADAAAKTAARRKRNPLVWLNSTRTAVKTAAERIASSEAAHEFDAEGHATRAKELIAQAKAELDLAVQYVKDHPAVAETH